MNVLERIQKLSKKNGISVGFLEENLGIGRGTIYKWNKSAPNTENLVKVADYFNVSIDYLLGIRPFTTFSICVSANIPSSDVHWNLQFD